MSSDRARIRDWIFETNLTPWLEIVARLARYDLHPDEPAGVVVGLKPTDSEADRWLTWELNDVRLRIAADPGSAVLMLDLDAPVLLRAHIETAIMIAQEYTLVTRHGAA